MSPKEAAQMIERILDPDPWEDDGLSDKMKEAQETAVGALEKQIPKEPMEEDHSGEVFEYRLYCPFCGSCIGYRGLITGRIAQKYENEYYCGKCGQAIDWKEGEG